MPLAAASTSAEKKSVIGVVQNASFKPQITVSETRAGPRKQGLAAPFRSALKYGNIRPGQ